METLQERLQREAREKMKEAFDEHAECSWLNGAISHTISETLKEAVRVIEELPCHKHGGVLPNGKIPAAILVEDLLQALSTTITAVEGLGDKK